MNGHDIVLLAVVMFGSGLCAGLILWPYIMRFR